MEQTEKTPDRVSGGSDGYASMSDTAAILRDVRTTAGVSVVDLAKSLGVSRNTVTNWERGTSEPTVSQFDAICESLSAANPRLRLPAIAQWILHSPLSDLRRLACELKENGVYISFVCGAESDA